MRFYYRSVQYGIKCVFMLLSLLWHVLVNIYYSLSVIYTKWFADGLRTPCMVLVDNDVFYYLGYSRAVVYG